MAQEDRSSLNKTSMATSQPLLSMLSGEPGGWRRPTQTALMGGLPCGSSYPIRCMGHIKGPLGSTAQILRDIEPMMEAGCDLVSIEIAGLEDLTMMHEVQATLEQKGVFLPLFIDVGRDPSLAWAAAEIGDGVRLSPVTLGQDKSSATSDHSTNWKPRLLQLVEHCHRLEKSLLFQISDADWSDVQGTETSSPVELIDYATCCIELCRQAGHLDFMVSVETRVPILTIQVIRLLAEHLDQLARPVPLHLIDRQPKRGELGRLRAAAHLGALLLEGIGDCIEIDLAEDPEHEIETCRRLLFAQHHFACLGELIQPQISSAAQRVVHHPYCCAQPLRRVIPIDPLCLRYHDHLVAALGEPSLADNPPSGTPSCHKLGDCLVWVTTPPLHEEEQKGLSWLRSSLKLGTICPANSDQLIGDLPLVPLSHLVHQAPLGPYAVLIDELDPDLWQHMLRSHPQLILFQPDHLRILGTRALASWCYLYRMTAPIILAFEYDAPYRDALMQMGMELGPLLMDGAADGLALLGPYDPYMLSRISQELLRE